MGGAGVPASPEEPSLGGGGIPPLGGDGIPPPGGDGIPPLGGGGIPPLGGGVEELCSLQPKPMSKANETTTTGLTQLGTDLNNCFLIIDLALSSRGVALKIGAIKCCLSSIKINSSIAPASHNLHAMTIIRRKHAINTYPYYLLTL